MDRFFRVEIDEHGSSPSAQQAIWRAQHQCVDEGFAWDAKVPSADKAGQAIIKHELQGDRGHYSVLTPAYLVLHAQGFPHSVVSQITRHSDSHFLVQSGRYTSKRFCKVATADLEVDEVFYFRTPDKKYVDRQGHRYIYSKEDYVFDRHTCIESCIVYKERIDKGWAEEHARDMLPYNFRQNFMMAGNLQDVFHWLDQRSKSDSQFEIRSFAELAMAKVLEFAPELGNWYFENRYGRARLAP